MFLVLFACLSHKMKLRIFVLIVTVKVGMKVKLLTNVSKAFFVVAKPKK